MKKKLNPHHGLVLIMLLSLAFAAPAMAQPVGKLLPLADTGEQMLAMKGTSADQLQTEIPSREVVGLPVYPDAFFGENIDGMGQMLGVSLLTGDSIEVVKAWYAEQEGLSWSDAAEAYYTGDAYIGVARTESIKLADISGNPDENMSDGLATAGLLGMVYDISGMKTLITIYYAPGKAD